MPGAAAAVHRELGGLEQQKLVVSQFWGPEVWNHGRRGASDDLTQAVPGSGDSWLEAAQLQPHKGPAFCPEPLFTPVSSQWIRADLKDVLYFG